MYGLNYLVQQLAGKEIQINNHWWHIHKYENGDTYLCARTGPYTTKMIPLKYERIAGDCGAINVHGSRTYLEQGHHAVLRKLLPKLGINFVFLSLSVPLTERQVKEYGLTFRFTKRASRKQYKTVLHCYTWEAPEEEMVYGYFYRWNPEWFPTRTMETGESK